MTLPSMHGWTHRPKALGGTDPIQTVQPITALGLAFSRSQACNSLLEFDFDEIYTNDDSFGFSDVTSGRAQFITISRVGLYKAQFVSFWDSAWTAGDNPLIVPNTNLGDLVPAADITTWDDTQNIVYGEQFTADESAHLSLAATVYFTFDPAYWGFASLGIGVNLESQANRTKSFAAKVIVTWIGDLLTEVTIA